MLRARRSNKHRRDKLWTLNVKLQVFSEAKADVQTLTSPVTYPAADLKINKNNLFIAFSSSCMLFKSFCIPWVKNVSDKLRSGDFYSR